MFPLLSAIQRKAWVDAKRLSHELIQCDSDPSIYHELHLRIDQIINLAHQQRYPRSPTSQPTMASDDSDESDRQQSAENDE